MRKLLLILSVLFCFAASAQYQIINRPLQYVNTFGYQYERFHSMYLMGLPNDTVAVPALLQNIPFIANKAGSIYLWNISTFVWDLFSSGGGTPNLVVQRAGTGIVQHYIRNDSLFLEDIEGDGTYITASKSADSTVTVSLTAIPVSYVIAASDETTDITTGTAKVTFRMPHAMTVTGVRASVNTASSSGLPTIDINESGTTILSTKITIDVSEKSSTTAVTPPVISDSALADDAEITIDIDVSGTGAKGLKIIITGTRI